MLHCVPIDTPRHAFETLSHAPLGILNITFWASQATRDRLPTLEEPTMNPFTAHPRQQRVTYVEHWRFAMGIAFRLLASAVAFAAHAILPAIPIEPKFDLEATADYLRERNRWIETAKRVPRADLQSDLAVSS